MNPAAPIGAVPPEMLDDLPPMALQSLPGTTAPADTGFGRMFSEGVAQVNESLLASQVDMQRLATGDVQNLHQVMIRLEESKLSFDLMLQVRNRLLEAYQDVMKMQV